MIKFDMYLSIVYDHISHIRVETIEHNLFLSQKGIGVVCESAGILFRIHTSPISFETSFEIMSLFDLSSTRYMELFLTLKYTKLLQPPR